MRKWQFADLHVLRDISTGYEIHLEGGTWFHPKKLKPKAPEGMNFSTQLQLLRQGLQHIKSIGGQIEIETIEAPSISAA